MPKLLKSDEVQLHMPRTGGKSLAKELGVKEIIGTMHDGPGQIPDRWRDYPTVATFRDPLSWRKSMKGYLKKLDSNEHYHNFVIKLPHHSELECFDPTFGLWADPENRFFSFLCSQNFKTWYEAYVSYFLSPADRIVPISQLSHWIKK